ncbi:hypothetical protein [Amphritea balenae]|uniref:Uncharacterized protein n=1 Tax=Amphritea balenae TaxID=452629 RepID=A0A3P1SIS5_9GAMM|nr:hypothetical protein [Amphritea balenae]RRC96937.1 hypothetical protein EHS89_19565 [Amphritea balenae]GGK85512.1 hypothetical protein GCM10007941_40020 [Amphritea balenae]
MASMKLLNSPFGIWVLSSLIVGTFGFSYSVYSQERELTLERLRLLAEIRYRMDKASIFFSRHEKMCFLIENNSNENGYSNEHTEDMETFFDVFLDKQNIGLFDEYSKHGGYALIIDFEINLKRSYFKEYIDDSQMNIEDIHKDLSLLIVFRDKYSKGDENGLLAISYLASYTSLAIYFQYMYSKYYLDGEYDHSNINCSDT